MASVPATEQRPFRRLVWVAAGNYFTAATAVGATFLVRLAGEPVLANRSPFILFVLPVVIVALVSGRGPALFAVLLSLVAGLSFANGNWATPDSLIEALMFVIVCGAIVVLEGRRTAQREVADRTIRQLELLLEQAAGYALFMLGADGSMTTWNGSAERVLGWNGDAVIGHHIGSILSGTQARAKADAQLAEARQNGHSAGEAWLRRGDGSEFIASISLTPIRDASGGEMGFAAIIHDITLQRAAEQAARQREEHLRSILATVPDAMVVIDEKGIMLSFSPAAECLFGYSEADTLGRNVSMLMPSPYREGHDGYIERYLTTGDRRIIGIGRIVSGLRADGSTFPMALSVGEAHVADQRLFTGFIQDLTERRDFEARLEQLQSELFHVSRLSAMGTMASTLAHELNQPLTAIASFGEAACAILEEPTEPDRELLREVFSEMAAESLRAGRIVRRLREFVSKGDMSKTIEDLPRVIQEASALALVGATEKGVTAQFSFAPEATPVLIDRVQIQQVLINLLRNAIEAMEGTDTKRLSVTTSVIDAGTVQVSVTDTGCGIDEQTRKRLFEAFNSSKAGGMGVGLSICRTIVEAHGGRIAAVAQEESGTTFHFTLIRTRPQETGR